VGSTIIVRQLFMMDYEISDEPGPDGTTAFSIALGRGYKHIVKLFLDFDIGHSSSLYLESLKSTKIISIANDIKNQ
jgi:ankyrin repeat protein